MHQTPKCKLLDLTVFISDWIPLLYLVSWIPPHVCVLLVRACKDCGLIWRCGSRTGDEACWAGPLEDIDIILESKTLPFVISCLLGPNWKEHTICFYTGQQIVFLNKTLATLTFNTIPRTGWLQYNSFCKISYFCFFLERYSSIHQEQFPDLSYISRKSCLISNKWLIAKSWPFVDVITFSQISEWSEIFRIES